MAKNIQDDFIEYNIYKECTKEDKGNNYFDNSGYGILGWIFIILIVLALLSECGG